MRADRSYDELPSLGQDTYARLEGSSASGGFRRRLDRYFKVTERGSSFATEVRAGCITWMTMSYIMVVNPVILSAADPTDLRLGEPVMTATAMSAAFGSLLVGVFANAPVGLMSGMGLNAYFAYGICHAFNVTWQEALTCCFASGLLLVLLSALGICQALVRKLLTEHLKKAITVAIGLFQALIGFQVMKLVVPSKDTLITLGDIGWSSELHLSLFGLCAISLLLVRQVHGALLFGIMGMAVCSWCTGLSEPPHGVFGVPTFGATFALDFSAWAPSGGKLVHMVVGTSVLLFVSLFDLAGVQYGLFGMAHLLEDGAVPKSNAIFASAGAATMLGALMGTSPVIIANESSAGIMEGSKTGLSALVVSALFIVSAFITPLLIAIPKIATAVPLVLIGAFMMSPARGIDWDNLRVAIPSFLTITVVPFTYSIHNGIIAGIFMDLMLACMSKNTDVATCVADRRSPRPSSTSGDREKSATIDDTSASSQGILGGAVMHPSPNRRRQGSDFSEGRKHSRLSTPYMKVAGECNVMERVEHARMLVSELRLRSDNLSHADGCQEAHRDEALEQALEAFLEGKA